jgi:hypothetical protein
MIGISLIYTIANPCVIANQATGKVKVYQAVVGGILLMILPISYIVLKLGAPAYSVFIVHFCVESMAQIARMYMLRKLIDLPMRRYLQHIYAPVVMVVLISCLLPLYIQNQLSIGLIRFLLVGITCVISVGITTLIFGLTKNERNVLINKVLNILHFKR